MRRIDNGLSMARQGAFAAAYFKPVFAAQNDCEKVNMIKSACMKARVCKLFTLKAIPYVTLSLIVSMGLFPPLKVALAFIVFFYLIFSLTQFSTDEECRARCSQATS